MNIPDEKKDKLIALGIYLGGVIAIVFYSLGMLLGRFL